MPSRLFPLALFAILGFGSAAATDCERLESGDTVFSACPDAPFSVDSDAGTGSPMPLSEGVVIRVAAVTGNRVQGIAEIGGESRAGWISADKVHKLDDPESVAALRQLPGIALYLDRFGAVQRVDAQNSAFGGEAMAHLQGLYSLEGLELSGSRVTNDDLCQLENLSNLRWLYLDRTSVNDDGLLSLRHLMNLEVLVLSDSKVRGPGLVYLTKLRRLRVLNLSDCQLTDQSMSHLRGLSQVQTLALENAGIRGDGLVHLQAMARLNVLNLNGCTLRPGTLLHLKDAQYLRIVRIREATIPEADREQLLAANPRVAIFN